MALTRQVAVAMFVAGVVVAAVVLEVTYFAFPTPTQPAPCSSSNDGYLDSHGSNGQPFGSALAFGAPVDTTRGSDQWYNMTIESAGADLTVGVLSFVIRTPLGANLSAPSGDGVGIAVAATGSLEAAYVFGAGWVYDAGFKATSPVTTNDDLSVLYTGTNPAHLVGFSLVAFLQPPVCGTVSGTIT